LVENMAGLFPGPDAEAMARETGVTLCGRVPFDPGLAEATDTGQPFVSRSPGCPAAQALVELARLLRSSLESRSG
jgi:MinD-like ATPase involved in chromosome partitioning or flagellar assembly